MNDFTLTIIIPIYNAEKRLSTCLTSILNQTYKNIQVICIDDGSTDNSNNIYKDFCEKDSRFSYKKTSNHGVSYARNLGIELTKTEYLTFCDADDFWELDAYEKAMNFIKNNNVDCLCFEYKTIEKNDNYITHSQYDDKIYYKKDISSEILFPTLGFDNSNLSKLNITYPVWNKIFKKSILAKNNIRFNVKRKTTEDWQFCLDYFCEINTIYFLKNILYNYYHCDNQTLSRTKYIENSFDIVVADRIRYTNKLPNFPWESSISQLQFKNYWLSFAKYYYDNDKQKIYSILQHMFNIYQKKELYNYFSNLHVHKKMDKFAKKENSKKFIKTLLHYIHITNIKNKLHLNKFFRKVK